MIGRWKIGVIVLIVGMWSSPTHAASWLYHSDDTVAIGQESQVSGWRLLSTHDRALVSPLDQSQLQPNFSYHALFVPNDPDYGYQWNFINIQVPAAWDQVQAKLSTRGDSRIVVAVLDTGVATAAPDLASLHVWTNSGEVAADGVDNDHDGLVDDLHGWDFVNADNNPTDDNGHGTHITGTIAESTNNSLAAAGIADQVTIMPLKVLDSQGNGSTDTITAAVNYAVAHGANIINLSLGGNQDDPLLHQAIQTAASQGVLVVAAAGNDGGSSLNYPAAYSEALSVGATQEDNTRPSYSNYGSGLDVMAPGGNTTVDQNHDGQLDGILQQTCVPGNCSAFSSRLYEGTSQAAAHVSGVAALLASCGESTSQIAATLETTATDEGTAGVDSFYGYGLINASAAVTAAGCSVVAAPAAPADLTVVSGLGLHTAVANNQLVTFRQPVFHWNGPAGEKYQVSWGKSGTSLTTSQQVTTQFIPTINVDGQYSFSVEAVNSVGQSSVPMTFTYRYRRAAITTLSGTKVRLYDRDFHLIRQVSVPAGVQSLSAGEWSTDQSLRLFLGLPSASTSDVVFSTVGIQKNVLHPFGPKFSGGLTNAVVNVGGGKSQLVVATASAGAHLAWYSTSGKLVRSQLLYQTYRGGLNVGSGDIDGNGTDELITGQVVGGEVRVYSSTGQRLSTLYPLGRKYQGGWFVATADTNDDGHAEIIAVALGGGANHQVFALTLHGTVMKHWTVSTGSYRGPLAVTISDVIGDGFDRLYVGPEKSGSWIQQWSLDGVKERQINLASTAGMRLASLP